MRKKIFFIFCFTNLIAVSSQEKTVNELVTSQNSYNSATNISFNSTNKQNVLISVKNVLGKTVFKKKIMAHEGKNTIHLNRGNLKSGIYIYAIQTSKEIISKRFVLK